MKTKLFWTTSLLVAMTCLCARGQTFTGSLGFTGKGSFGTGEVSAPPAGDLWPTNIPGVTCYAWWEPSISAYVTNAGVATLSNLTSMGSALDLKQSSVGFSPTAHPNGIGSYPTLDFGLSGATWLTSALYTSPQPHEVVMLLSLTNNGNAVQTIIGGTNENTQTYTHQLDFGSSGTLDIKLNNVGHTVTTLLKTNQWKIIDVVFNNNSSTVYTNGVQGGAATWDVTDGEAGFCLGRNLVYNSTHINAAVVALFTFTNQTLGASAWSPARSNAFYYLTNRYGLQLPPP